jgi:hypothetical protein
MHCRTAHVIQSCVESYVAQHALDENFGGL